MPQVIRYEKPDSQLAVSTKNMSREQWLEARKSGIGGSDIAAIMGVSPYSTAYDVFISKTQDVKDTESEYAYWGHQLEDVVAREFAKRSGLKIQNVNFMMRHPVHTFAVANIDRAIVNKNIAGRVFFKDGALTTDTILECKTANEYLKKDWGDEDSDAVPDQYQCQAQWYMGVTGTQVCHMAVLIGGNKFRQYKIERHDEFIEVLFEEAERFWNDHVLTGIAPEATTLQNAKDKYPRHDPDTTLELSDDSEEIAIIDRYVELKEREKALKTEIEDAQTKLICLIGNNEAVTVDGDVALTYKTQVASRVNTKALKADMPEIAQLYTTVTESRVVRVK